VSCSRPDVPVRAISYSHIARPQLGHAGVLPTGCSDDLNKLDWGIASLLALPTNPRQRNLFRASVCHGLPEQWVGAHVRFGSYADILQRNRHVRFTPESRHVRCNSTCLLCAKSGHRNQWASCKFLIGSEHPANSVLYEFYLSASSAKENSQLVLRPISPGAKLH
jgi:hypothetical protein